MKVGLEKQNGDAQVALNSEGRKRRRKVEPESRNWLQVSVVQGNQGVVR